MAYKTANKETKIIYKNIKHAIKVLNLIKKKDLWFYEIVGYKPKKNHLSILLRERDHIVTGGFGCTIWDSQGRDKRILSDCSYKTAKCLYPF